MNLTDELLASVSSTPLASELASSTSILPFPTGSAPAWIYGEFPSSLTVTNNKLAEGLIADVPFYSVGILAIGVATFFLVMNRMQKYIFNAILATFLVFLSATLDLGQLVIVSWGMLTGTVFPLRIARELGYAVSFGLRFFFFWQFVAIPPRREILQPTPDRSPANMTSFTLESEFHSGSWDRWGLVGVMTKYTLLVGTIVIGVTQAIWRLGFAFGLVRFTSVYQIDSVIQIVVSSLFILKLAGNSYISHLTPRWKIVQDYLPIVAAISLGLGIAIGNLVCMLFSESPLGRFLQAIEFYILILYILVAAFYKMPVRESVLVDALTRQRTPNNSSFVGINRIDSMRASTFRVTPPNVSTPQVPTIRELEAADANRIQTGLLQPDNGRPHSTAERVTTWIQNRLSGRPGDRRLEQRLSEQDAESGQLGNYNYTIETKGSADSDASFMRPVKELDDGWRGATYASVRTPPTGTTTAVNDTPQHPKVPSLGEPSSSKLHEPSITPNAYYASAETRPIGPKGPPVIPMVYSSTVPGAFSSAVAASLAPVLPLSVRSLPTNPRLHPRDASPSPEPILPEPAFTTLRIPSPVLSESPSGTSFRVTREYGSPSPSLSLVPETQLDSRQQTANHGDESPIYGLEGIIQSLGGDLLPDEELRSQQGSTQRNSTAYSSGAASFLRKQADIERSVAKLQGLIPGSPSAVFQPLSAISGNVSPSGPSLGQESTSLQSDFTLSKFPSPPTNEALLAYPSFSQQSSVATRSEEIDLDDIRFSLTPPRMPAAAEGRQMSFPSSTRGSDIFQLHLGVPESPTDTQWDVTSFIGGEYCFFYKSGV
ncbi:putative transmembrane protein [Rhizoctonia solani 123E]|uniref:Putative transmembrane protein n=1 Tax=Rhizoctonia solani 123E TaxID=1423351 RepID=A0A074S4Y2_9AGAM|nr:putative transmembrane protein [Rhizoctonia solani 123E]